jgi:hypothetical protein
MTGWHCQQQLHAFWIICQQCGSFEFRAVLNVFAAGSSISVKCALMMLLNLAARIDLSRLNKASAYTIPYIVVGLAMLEVSKEKLLEL